MRNTGGFIALAVLAGILLSGNKTNNSSGTNTGTKVNVPAQVKMGTDSPLVNMGTTSNGTLVWDPAGFWDVWKNGRTINLNQYNGEAVATGTRTITAPPAPSTFDYHAVGLNIPTYNR